MLKTRIDDQIWLVPQPTHAQVSGYLAAHWGGANDFAQPGHYPGASHPALWRDEVILGIAEHDNGWWEWEAMPRINERDGLPVGLGEVVTPSPANGFDEWRSGGFDRWRRGIARISEQHPYGALLTSLHAYWLYAIAFDDLVAEGDEAFRHSVFGDAETASNLVGDRELARQFLEEQMNVQARLEERLARDPSMAAAVGPEHLNPHARLLQLLDSLSLILALNDTSGGLLRDVPRGSWSDRATISWQYEADRRISFDPYPFDQDPLPVFVPARTVPAAQVEQSAGRESPYALLHGAPQRVREFVFVSGG